MEPTKDIHENTHDKDALIKKLKEDVARVNSELSIFYELTQAMRTTLHLDEVFYIILTAITAHQGLSFNRAGLFLIDSETNSIKGTMGIGAISGEEANQIWHWIEEKKRDLYDLIHEYHRIQQSPNKPKFFELVKSISFPLTSAAGIIYEAFSEGMTLHIDQTKAHELQNDPLVKIFKTENFVIVPLWAQDKIIGAIFVDNFVTKKPITGPEIKILNMFTSQAALAIENSRIYETTLTKSHTDSLTGLWNYGYFQYRLDEEIESAAQKNSTVALLMLDLDNFKKYNDAFGHMEGDRALGEVAKILKTISRRNDITCRYGGEEFAVILPNTKKEEAIAIGERIRTTIENARQTFQTTITVSVGTGVFPADAQNKETLIKITDMRLYKAKSSGRNVVISE